MKLNATTKVKVFVIIVSPVLIYGQPDLTYEALSYRLKVLLPPGELAPDFRPLG